MQKDELRQGVSTYSLRTMEKPRPEDVLCSDPPNPVSSVRVRGLNFRTAQR